MNRLVTIAISNYCEKARWALNRAGVQHVEDAHLPLLHWRASLGARGGRTVPVWVAEDAVYGDSTDILLAVDRLHPELGLLGQSPAERSEILAWEERFDAALAPEARRWAYFRMLPDRDFTLALVGVGAPTWERRVFVALFPLFRATLRRALRVTPAGFARSMARIEEVFAEVGARVGQGRRYLVGERFTAADLCFAALAAPLLCPPEHPVPIPPLSAFPPEIRADVETFRATPAGAFALRLYREERRCMRARP